MLCIECLEIKCLKLHFPANQRVWKDVNMCVRGVLGETSKLAMVFLCNEVFNSYLHSVVSMTSLLLTCRNVTL